MMKWQAAPGCSGGDRRWVPERSLFRLRDVDLSLNRKYNISYEDLVGRAETSGQPRKHGLDFADLNETFFDNALLLLSYRRRWRGIGMNIRGVVAVVFVTLGKEAVSVIVCVQPISRKGNAMPNIKKKGYSARDLREVSDNPEFTKEDFAKAKPFAEVFPELAASIRRGRGPNKAPTKKLVSIRLSEKVLEAYRAKGQGWQSKIDEDLRRLNKIK